MVKTVKAGIGNLWADLTEIEGLLTTVLVAQAALVDAAPHVGIPVTIASNILGGVSLAALIVQKILAAHAAAQAAAAATKTA